MVNDRSSSRSGAISDGHGPSAIGSAVLAVVAGVLMFVFPILGFLAAFAALLLLAMREL
jgi:hypothetical protein